MNIVVFSPHLDDAALDVSDHIRAWKVKGHTITVISVFTSFDTQFVSPDTRRYSGMENRTPREFELLRKQEDRCAMRLLDVKTKYLDLVDGGFRTHETLPVYSDFAGLLSGTVSPHDKVLEREIADRMKPHRLCDAVFVPMGIGGHADHILVRSAAERVFAKSKLGYYADYPYALSLQNFLISHIVKMLFHERSVVPFGTNKLQLITCYDSQMPGLFSGTPRYPEIVLYPKVKLTI